MILCMGDLRADQTTKALAIVPVGRGWIGRRPFRPSCLGGAEDETASDRFTVLAGTGGPQNR